jgi:hypothetical protein
MDVPSFVEKYPKIKYPISDSGGNWTFHDCAKPTLNAGELNVERSPIYKLCIMRASHRWPIWVDGGTWIPASQYKTGQMLKIYTV